MTGRTILILTNPADRTVDQVVDELNRREVPVFRCDTSDFPRHLAVSAYTDGGWNATLRLGHRDLSLSDVHCAYYRKPGLFDFPEHLSGTDREWASRQAKAGLGGILTTVPRWINHPVAIGRAEYKPLQLKYAVEAGLRVPRTLITNDPDEAYKFGRSVGGVVHKTLTPPMIWPKTLYTTEVDPADLDDPGITLTTHLFQERIPKRYEVRLTVVDGQLFPARIDAHSAAAALDFRSDYDNTSYSVVDLPDSIIAPIRQLMDRLELRFGAIDFIVTPDGEHIFLEINPNGQWGWIEAATGLPICQAVTEALLKDY